jgi:hypothetical protein
VMKTSCPCCRMLLASGGLATRVSRSHAPLRPVLVPAARRKPSAHHRRCPSLVLHPPGPLPGHARRWLTSGRECRRGATTPQPLSTWPAWSGRWMRWRLPWWLPPGCVATQSMCRLRGWPRRFLPPHMRRPTTTRRLRSELLRWRRCEPGEQSATRVGRQHCRSKRALAMRTARLHARRLSWRMPLRRMWAALWRRRRSRRRWGAVLEMGAIQWLSLPGCSRCMRR